MDKNTTIISDGTSQNERMAVGLRPNHFCLDERSLPEILFLGSRLASQLTYFDLDNQAAGDWRPLFTQDPSALIGVILAESAMTDGWQRKFAAFLNQIQTFLLGLGPCPTPENVPLFQIDSTLRLWSAECGRNVSDTTHRISDTIDGLIAGHLNNASSALAAYLAQHDESHANYWQKIRQEEAQVSTPSFPAANASYQEVSRFLTNTFRVYLSSLDVIHKTASDQFRLSLPGGRHDPATGLYLAFARLYLKARSSIDDFSQRELRFYYEQILRFRRRPVQAEQAYLVLVPDGTRPQAIVPPGTLFIGGEDSDGRERLYTSEKEAVITDTKVVALNTLYFDHDPLQSPEKDLRYASSAWTGSIPAQGGDDYYPLFGTSSKFGETTVRTSARLGFAVASPAIEVQEGLREITLDLHFKAGPEDLGWLIAQLLEIAGHGNTKEGVFYKVFCNAFHLYITTGQGWSEIPVYIPACQMVDGSVPEDCLRIKVELPESFPPVLGFNPKLHPGNYSTENAVIRLEIQPNAYLYPYDFLSRQYVDWIDIRVQVKGCRNLMLSNNNGALNATTPFLPFGPLPVVDSNLIIGCKEAFSKQITELGLNIDWGTLPEEGFKAHYQTYGNDISTKSFRISLAALNNRHWLPGKTTEAIDLPLFAFEDGTDQVNYNCNRLVPYLRPQDITNGRFSPSARGGFIRLSLSSPPQAFGHAEYPQLLAKALTRNTRLDALGPVQRFLTRKGMLPLPQPPYTPQITSISLDYVASARITPQAAHSTMAHEQFYHLHPFGTEPVSLSTQGKTPLIPIIPERANLFIELESSEISGTLSLYFHLRNDSTQTPGNPPLEFDWFCLNGTRWQKLEDYRILSDSTYGFLSSGIIQLDLPEISRAVHMPGHHYWLKVATNGDTSVLCSVYAIQTHGMTVRHVLDDGVPPALQVLPAGSIKRARTALPGIGKILQPDQSFGGQQEESQEAMIIRASERLRHRQRAVTPWDYERLVLQRFPGLHKVKCFSNTVFNPEPSGYFKPGHVLIVVVPAYGDIQDEGIALKENILLLDEIGSYLKSLSSPFVEIDVRNPTYERIQVRCAVSFQNSSNMGLSIKQLNRDICRYISPWDGLGNAANFGWSLRTQEIQGYLQGLPYVQAIKGLSMLRVVEKKQDYFELSDTALEAQNVTAEVTPFFPWSLAIPFKHHLIETFGESNGPWVSGISRLRVGTTFILSGS